jgi:hypothetical protein
MRLGKKGSRKTPENQRDVKRDRRKETCDFWLRLRSNSMANDQTWNPGYMEICRVSERRIQKRSDRKVSIWTTESRFAREMFLKKQQWKTGSMKKKDV